MVTAWISSTRAPCWRASSTAQSSAAAAVSEKSVAARMTGAVVCGSMSSLPLSRWHSMRPAPRVAPLRRVVNLRGRPGATAGRENEDVLGGKVLAPADQREAGGGPFREHLLDGHPVLDVDVGGGLSFEAVLDQDHGPPRCQAVADGGEHRLRLLKLMVDVHQQDAVDAVGRELGIGLGAEHGDDVPDPLLGGVLLEEVEHLGLDVLGVDFAGG